MVYWIFCALAALCRWVPLKWGYGVCGWLGRAAFRRFGRFRKITLFNLRIAFPGEDEGRLTAIGQQAFANQAKNAFEMLKFFYAPPAAGAACVDWEAAQPLLDCRGKPALLASAHSGSWELVASAFTHRGLALTVVAARLRHRGANRFVEESRTRKGLEVIYRDPQVVSKCLQSLKNGRQVALMADQHAGDRGVVITYMGHPAWAFKGPGRFALQTGMPVLPVFSWRKPDNRVVLTVGELITPPQEGDEGARQVAVAQAFHDQLAVFLRAHPESYFWMHRRFKGLVEGA